MSSSLNPLNLPQVAGDPSGMPRFRNRRFNLSPVPLQFPSLSHADEAMERLYTRGANVEGLRRTTVRWLRDGFRSFRTFLREDTAREQTFLSGNAVKQVQLIEDWMAWLRSRGVSHTSVCTYWRGLDAVFRRLEATEGMFNPFTCLSPPRASPPLPKALTRSAAEQLLHLVRNFPWRTAFERHRNLAIVGLMLLAGLRKGEVLKLTMSDVDLDAGAIHIERGKGKNGGKDRTAYATPQLVIVLGQYAEARRRAGKTHPEFVSSTSSENRRIGEVTIRRLFRILTREMNMRIAPHMLRHTYATLLRQTGVQDRVAQELLGHSSLAMLQRYSHVFDGECAAEAARLHLDF
jgi:integrase/recombinase XerD